MRIPLLIPAIVSFVFSTTAMATPADPLPGTYTMTIPAQEGGTITIKLVLTEEGTYTVDLGNDGTVNITGTYVTDGGQITIQDTGGDSSCGADKKGVYQYTNENGTFTMTRISDACEGRGGPEGKMVFKRI